MTWNGSDPVRMAKIAKISQEHCADPHLPLTLAPKLLEAGFEIEDRRAFPIFNPDNDDNPYSYGLIDMIASAAR